MFICNECDAMFNEPEFESVCMEEYNGVADLFPGSRTYKSFARCPECGSDDLEEHYCDEICEDCAIYDRCTLDEKQEVVDEE